MKHVVVYGPRGCGKTALLNTLLHAEDFLQGEFRVGVNLFPATSCGLPVIVDVALGGGSTHKAMCSAVSRTGATLIEVVLDFKNHAPDFPPHKMVEALATSFIAPDGEQVDHIHIRVGATTAGTGLQLVEARREQDALCIAKRSSSPALLVPVLTTASLRFTYNYALVPMHAPGTRAVLTIVNHASTANRLPGATECSRMMQASLHGRTEKVYAVDAVLALACRVLRDPAFYRCPLSLGAEGFDGGLNAFLHEAEQVLAACHSSTDSDSHTPKDTTEGDVERPQPPRPYAIADDSFAYPSDALVESVMNMESSEVPSVANMGHHVTPEVQDFLLHQLTYVPKASLATSSESSSSRRECTPQGTSLSSSSVSGAAASRWAPAVCCSDYPQCSCAPPSAVASATSTYIPAALREAAVPTPSPSYIPAMYGPMWGGGV